MPDAKKKGGNPLTRRLGPLPIWGWAAAGGGGFILYRFVRARRATGAAIAATGTTGGGATGTIPIGGTGVTSPIGTAAGTFASVAAWEQAMLTFLTGNGLSPGDAFSAVTSFLNGNCVSQAAYNAISQALVSSSVGLPPGFSATSTPTLSVCPVGGQTPTPSNPYGTEVFQGSGYNAGSVATAIISAIDGSKYSWLPSEAAVQAAQANGTPIYYQPTPGNFQLIGPNFNQWANTPIFEKVG